ncbi:zinc-finger domain-containing protein [Microvirga tunisiensis]|uniref:Zinc-finger domain-containing protein n=2 Tax=Pannonibacter tanglangensis TaxID=2750084 RepID=A0A7X5F034_9HYPH|nr:MULTISPECIES: zinc-finger domain-containing protein [unclassified Pannonibacter]NBN63629.1 zinc-finger domain-containing protein [Pannonibacter sp. XCT-34]NBN77263.1 zinc-finger domain-containing protein [Pannonibacter sp. XCT-53]
MADHVVPHFQNTSGHECVEIGAREFMCIGANPPFDHPHVFLDLGDDDQIVCPYCSTLYKYNASLKPGQSEPSDCVWVPVAA